MHDGETLVDVTHASAETLRTIRLRHVAMVFQQFGLLPWRSVRENVGLGLELGGQAKAERNAQVDKQLALVGLTDWADRKVAELSGGMQQRVGLARAFATDAPILLMDEPFSALDPLIRTKLQDELLELQQRLKRTIIFVSHDLDEAFKIGNRIAIMEGGRIVQCGTPQEIFRNPSNEYVADFVKHMNPLGVLRARDVMREGTPEPQAPTVDADARVQEVMTTLVSCETDLTVTEGMTPIGVIGKNDVLAYLSDPTGAGASSAK